MTYDIILLSEVVSKIFHQKSLGPYQLASHLRRQGYSVKVINHFSEFYKDVDEFNRLLDRLIGPNTVFVGVSGTFFGRSMEVIPTDWQSFYRRWDKFSGATFTNDELSGFFLDLKHRHPHIKIVYGGVKARRSPDFFKGIDWVVSGLAEKMVIDLLDHLKTGRSIQFYPMDGYKVIDYDILGQQFDFHNQHTEWTQSDHIVPGEAIPLETSRGCMFACKFCSFPLLGRSRHDNAYQKHLDQLTREFANNWDRHKVNRYYFIDDTFNESSDKIELVLEAVRKAGVPSLEFSAYIRGDLCVKNPEQLPLLKELGLSAAFLGVESLNRKSLKAIGKGLDPELVKQGLVDMKTAMPDTLLYGSFIIGLPYETRATLNSWLPWVQDPNCPLDTVVLRALEFYKGAYNSEFARDPEKYGYRFDHNGHWYNDEWNYSSCWDLSNEIMQGMWESGRAKLQSWDAMGLLGLGYDFAWLRQTPLKDLPYQDIFDRKRKYFETYKNLLLEYEKDQTGKSNS
jgi:hypothetical protein